MFSLLHTLFFFLVALAVLIAFHEWGHYWAARRLGVKVIRFSLGFGRPIWSYRKTPDDTEFTVAALPLGGYVRMVDEREGEVAPADLPYAFNRQPVLRRVELAFLVFNAVESGAWIAILLYAYQATGPASVGLVAVAQLLPAGMFAPVAATLGDRYRRVWVLFAGYLLLGLALTLTAVAMLRDGPPLLVYALAITGSVAVTLIRPSQGALLPSLARTPAELTAANAVSGIVEAGGLLAGPLLAAGTSCTGRRPHHGSSTTTRWSTLLSRPTRSSSRWWPTSG